MSFAGIAIVMNASPYPLPRRLELTKQELGRLHSLQARKHLKAERVERNQKGEVVRVVPVLTDEDRAWMDEAELKVKLEQPLRVGDTQYRFMPYGKQGSVWVMPEGHANHITTQLPEILVRVPMAKLGSLPEGVTPIQPGRIPSPNMVTFGVDNLDDAMTDGQIQGESMQRALILKDGGVANYDTDSIPRIDPLLDDRPDVYPRGGQAGKGELPPL